MKFKSHIFIIACLAIMLLPAVGMLFFPTTTSSENKAMAEAPVLMKDGAINKKFFDDFDNWFNDHIAFRNQMVYADAMIQTKIFQESSVSGVIKGTDGWLYYSSTLDDYLGSDVLTDRELFNLSHNLYVVQSYMDERDITFVVMIPPNKNTLYGEHMPYYDNFIVSTDHSAILLADYMPENTIHYLDLFELFGRTDEVLYLRQDSHWNNKGALMVYNAMMDSMDIEHEDYSSIDPVMVLSSDGDLNKMLYSFYGPAEYDYDYQIPQNYTYVQGEDVESRWIVTENPDGSGTILVFRDSFANSLIPFVSNHFVTAAYSKALPNPLEKYIETYNPSYIVIEKVERNISDYLTMPPVLTAPSATVPDNCEEADTDSTVQVEACMYDVNYWAFSGTIDSGYLSSDTEIIVSIDGKPYMSYQTGEDGWLLYLKKADFESDTAHVEVFTVSGGQCSCVLSSDVVLAE